MILSMIESGERDAGIGRTDWIIVQLR
jgi:hypothetical protein